ncbi:MAG: beta-propeller fold lactonase family protein [Oenococcus oeni]
MERTFAFVGNWFFSPRSMGISVYEINPDTLKMKLIDTYFKDVAVGQQYLDSERNILYVVNERGDLPNYIGGGGYIMAIKINPLTGGLSLINKQRTMESYPCYFVLDKSKNYGIVVHHTDDSHVTKIIKGSDGNFTSTTIFDDAADILFKVNSDGSIGKICDVHITSGSGVPGPHTLSRHHSVANDPSGKLFVVCDKGMDKLYSYHIDRKRGKLNFLTETTVETGLSPRYGLFHPTLPIYYANNEKKPILIAYHYNSENGKLVEIQRISLLRLYNIDSLTDTNANKAKIESADILISPDGNFIYVSIRGINVISTVKIDSKGHMTLKQDIDCGGINPRGLALSSDKKSVFSTNMESGNITTFNILKDGTLCFTGQKVKCDCPANISIASFETEGIHGNDPN